MSTTNELDDLDYCCGDLGSISRGEQLYPPELIDLRTNGSSRDDLQLDVRQKIIEGLTEKNPKVPGQSLVDRAFTYQKTIPTRKFNMGNRCTMLPRLASSLTQIF